MNLGTNIFNEPNILLITIGIITGTIARIITLKVDYRQTPSYPNGYFIHLIIGLVTSALGAITIPAIIAQDFAAITFLALAIENLRDVRRIVAESLEKLEKTEYTTRGAAYIDGIAKTFEARNYITLVTSITTVLAMVIFPIKSVPLDILIGIICASVVFTILKHFTNGKSVGDICNIKSGKITVEGSDLFVDGIFISNHLGKESSRELFLKEGIAVVIEPKDDIFRITLENYGQRQAILFEALKVFGVKRYNFTRRSFSTGKIIITFVPVINDIEKLIEVVKQTPILENSRKIRRIISNPLIGGK